MGMELYKLTYGTFIHKNVIPSFNMHLLMLMIIADMSWKDHHQLVMEIVCSYNDFVN